MMKRQENKQRIYLWDYLWWVGERLHEYHLRITGENMLFMYINFLLFVPVMSLLAFASVYHTFQQCMWGVYLVLVLVYVIWGEKLYGVRRRKAVMSHYADRRFKPACNRFSPFLPASNVFCGYDYHNRFIDEINNGMKNNDRQRFYLWDYLWWMGEKLEQARRTGRVDGEMMLSIYIFALLIFPMMTVTIRLFPGVSALLPCVVFSFVTFAVMSLVSRIYKWRGKAVMSHYAKCRFNELLAVLLFFLAIAIICFMMYLLDKK